MDMVFKPRVEETEQMTQNWAFRNPRINESAKSRPSDMYVAAISCFHSISRLKTLVGGGGWGGGGGGGRICDESSGNV